MNVHSRCGAAILGSMSLTVTTATRPPLPADLRSAGILESVRRAFAEKGFDGASMQDLARVAGMSVGNFYRYFPSKAAIVEAIIAGDLAEMERDFAAIQTSPAPMDMLRTTIRQRIMNEECVNDGQLWAEITAAALRKPEIGAAANRMEAEIIGYLTRVFAQATGVSDTEAHVRFAAHAALIVMMVQASAMQLPGSAAHNDDLTKLVLRTIDRTLDDILATRAKG